MSKPASQLTVDIRDLCDETDLAITHAQARPRLKALGHKIVRDPDAYVSLLTAFLDDSDRVVFEFFVKRVMAPGKSLMPPI